MKKTALVVGASSGVGFACIKSLSQSGFSVMGAARRVDRIKTGIDSLQDNDAQHEAVYLDVKDETNIRNLTEDLQSRKMIPDVIIYCTGVRHYGLIDEIEKDSWFDVFAANVKGAFDLCASLVPLIKDGSKIIFVGSTAGLKPLEGGSVYCSSKAALHALALSLRDELRPRNISVSLIIPGTMNTEFWDTKRPDADDLMSPEFIAQLIATTANAPTKSEISEIVVRPITEI